MSPRFVTFRNPRARFGDGILNVELVFRGLLDSQTHNNKINYPVGVNKWCIHTDSDQIISSSVVQRKEFLDLSVSWHKLDRRQKLYLWKYQKQWRLLEIFANYIINALYRKWNIYASRAIRGEWPTQLLKRHTWYFHHICVRQFSYTRKQVNFVILNKTACILQHFQNFSLNFNFTL